MRLYLFDVPKGLSMRILAIAIVASESSFERAVEAAAPVVDSVEFHAHTTNEQTDGRHHAAVGAGGTR